MKKSIIRAIFILFLSLILPSQKVQAQINFSPKPITGTFIFPDFSITTDKQRDDYLDEIKVAGIDTLVWSYSGVVSKSACTDSSYIEQNFITDNRPNYLENADKFFQSAYDKGFSLYIGLAGIWQCVDVSGDQPEIIDFSKRLASSAIQMSKVKGWNDNFIKGFYIPQELDIHKFYTGPDAWPAYFNFYVNLSAAIKSIYPTKKILLSPYQWEADSYQTIYDNIKYAIANTSIDIYTPQDSVGAGNVKTFARDQDHFKALHDAVRDANAQYGKNVEAWANIETFAPIQSNQTFPPTNFKTLRWQIRAAEEQVSKKITWLYSWSMMNSTQAGATTMQYTNYPAERSILHNDYLNKPIIFAVFPWYTPENIVIKGYNFGSLGDQVGIYVHYNNQSLKTQIVDNNLIFNIGQPYMEIRIPMTNLPGFDWNQPYDIAIQNKDGYVSYYQSQNPDTQPDPSFPEIAPFPTITPISSPTPTPTPIPSSPSPTPIPPTSTPIPPSSTPIPPTPIPGDYNHNGVIDMDDMNYFFTLFSTNNPSGDFNHNGIVDIYDYSTLVGGFEK